MILQSLAKLAQREGLVDNPDYETKEVHWEILLKPDGRFVDLISLLTKPAQTGRAKPRDRGPSIQVPRPFPGAARAGTAPDAGFLVENAAFVLGLDLTKEQRVAKRFGEAERRMAAFRRRIEDGARVTGEAGLAAVVSFLRSAEDVALARRKVLERTATKEFAPNHLVVFRVEDEDQAVHLHDTVVRYWTSVRSEAPVEAKGRQCLITGCRGPVIDKHPPIKKVPGGTPSGVAIVTFNSSAFESYGLQRNDNAPVSRPAAEAYTTALNRLLDSSYPDPRDPNVRLPEQRVQLSDDTVAVFWTDEDSPLPAAIVPAVGGGEPEAMAALGIDPEVLAVWQFAAGGGGQERPSTERLRAAHHAPWTGIRPEQLRDRRPFRLLILSGGQGRATVRAFHSAEVSTTVASVRQWFSDLALCSLKGRPALYRLLAALAVRGDRKNLPPNLAGEVFLAILAGGPLPASVLETTVRRCRSEANSRDSGGRELHNLKVIPERAALLKAWLNRARRDKALQARLTHQGVVFQEVRTTMNDQERNKGYLLGRMFACVERMQALALGEVGASITDRYFGSACATPQAVFPRLLKNEVHHYRKAREGRLSGTARWLHRQIDQLATWLVGEANSMQEGETVEAFIRRTAGHPLIGFPAFLPLPEQGLFVLGYHQQRAEFFTKHEATEEPTSEDETQPVGAKG